jgi:hypothetical protein
VDVRAWEVEQAAKSRKVVFSAEAPNSVDGCLAHELSARLDAGNEEIA